MIGLTLIVIVLVIFLKFYKDFFHFALVKILYINVLDVLNK